MNLAQLGVSDATPVGGGCIHRCFRGLRAGRPVFVKTNGARYADTFACEAEGLAALRSAGAAAPAPLAHGTAGGDAYLLMEFLDLRAHGDYGSLGSMLAHVHGTKAKAFGWGRDNYIGSTPQANGWCDDWKTFWRERRLLPQVLLAEKHGFRIDIGDACDLLDGHAPPPSLVHGDLWSGNAAFLPEGRAVLFDPAVYYGDLEVDLAMTELFGGFPREFYAAYGALPAGYEVRKHLYNLYHLLNHLNLFGAGYLAQVESTLGLLLRAP